MCLSCGVECRVYEDGPDEVVLRVDRPVQLLGVGLCGSESGYTAELEVLEVGEDFSEEVRTARQQLLQHQQYQPALPSTCCCCCCQHAC